MLFNNDADEGSRMVLWLVPDNPGVTPSVVVLIADREEIRISATVLRTDVERGSIMHLG